MPFPPNELRLRAIRAHSGKEWTIVVMERPAPRAECLRPLGSKRKSSRRTERSFCRERINMSTPATPDDLLKLVQKSGLIEEHKLAAFVQAHERDGLMQSDVKKVAATMVRDGLITYFQGEQFLLGKWRGFTLGKFKLLERIGVGGMGQVFLCEHTFMRKRMAVKVLPPT